MVKITFSTRKKLTGYIFVSPWLFGAIFLLLYPFVYSLYLSFMNIYDITAPQGFVGIKHYKNAFVTDMEFVPKFLSVVSDTLINTPMIVILSLIIAIMVSRDIRLKGFFRSVFFLPVLLGTGFVMKQVLGQNVDQQAMEVARGILLPAKIQYYIGPEMTGYVTEFFNRITIVMWKSGVQIIIALAGIQGISTALYESARIDGATEWEMFWKITLPMISPILLLNTVYTIISSLTDDSKLMEYIIEKTFQSSEMEYASAMGWIYFLFILLLLSVVFVCMRPFVKRVTDN